MRSGPGRLLDEALAATALQLAAAVTLSAGASWLIASGRGGVLMTGAVLGLGVIGLLRWPALTLVVLLIVCQELDPSADFAGSAGGTGLLYLGHQLFFKTVSRFSLVTLTTIICFARIAVVAPPRRPRKLAVGLVLLMGGYYTALLWTGGSSLTSAINQDSRFAILFATSFVVGASARGSRQWQRNAIPILQWVLTAMALLGTYLTATGQGQAQAGVNLIFYDSALGAIAGAIVIAAALAPPSARTWRVWWLAAASLIVVVLSSRRNVWAAMIVALLVGMVFTHQRGRTVLRAVASAAIALVAVELFLPAVGAAIGHQFAAIWAATQGSAADASVQGHLSDVTTGWHAILASPLSGVGPNGHVAGLVVQSNGPLYIHNQVLESWLRFGLAGAVLVIAVQIALVGLALRTLRDTTAGVGVRWAAYLLIMAPVAMLTAPFLTNTQRWPAVLGLAAGLLAARAAPASPRTAGPASPTATPPPPGSGPSPSPPDRRVAERIKSRQRACANPITKRADPRGHEGQLGTGRRADLAQAPQQICVPAQEDPGCGSPTPRSARVNAAGLRPTGAADRTRCRR